MKSTSPTIRYASKQDYLNRKPVTIGKDKVDALSKGKDALAKTKPTTDTSAVSQAKPKGLSEIKDKVEAKVHETGEAGKHLLTQAGTSIVRGLTSLVTPSLPSVGVEVNEAPAQISEVKDAAPAKSGRKLVDKPGIFFVKGFSLNPFEAENSGLGEMATNIPTAQTYKWDNKSEIIEAIKSRPHGQPIILVGHGMGGDTVVDVARELNSVEHGFRTIDLMVTLDSIGTDNDIIPQNVKDNYNLISDQDFFFNDGPNVARKKEMTHVSNELRTENHNELETSPEVQFLVYDKINTTLMQAVAKKNFAKQLDQNFKQRMMSSHQLNPSGDHLKELLN